ncbi:MAG: hypothetical protein ACYCVB_02310, partial [Bacilli bacterium]
MGRQSVARLARRDLQDGDRASRCTGGCSADRNENPRSMNIDSHSMKDGLHRTWRRQAVNNGPPAC